MIFKNAKHLCAIFLLLAFTSQSVASFGAFCVMFADEIQQMSESMENADNPLLSMLTNAADSSHDAMACCNNDCQCPVDGCTSLTLLSSVSGLVDVLIISNKVDNEQALLLHLDIPPLLRPPISV